MKATILSYAEGLGLGDSRTGLTCPVCRGGINKDVSFVVTRKPEGVLYYCYRAKCGTRGMLYSVDRALMRKDKPKKKVFLPRYYEYDTVDLAQSQKEWFYERNGITDSELVRAGVKYNPDRNSYVFPIRDYRGYDIGVEDRVYDGSRDLKSIHYWFNDAPKVHFTTVMVREQPSICIVEDMLSGIKTSRYTPTVVALGTALNEKIEYVRRFSPNLILYLDKDALGKATGYKRKYSMFFDSVRIVYTPTDPKDTSDDELRRLLNG